MKKRRVSPKRATPLPLKRGVGRAAGRPRAGGRSGQSGARGGLGRTRGERSIFDFPSDSPDAGHAGAEFLKAKPHLNSPK